MVREEGRKYGYPYAHLLANAGITRDQGAGIAWTLSLGKEFFDLFKGTVLLNKESLYSAFIPIDFRMNAFGRQIGREIQRRHRITGETLKTLLEQFKNYPEGAPGPFCEYLYGDTPLS